MTKYYQKNRKLSSVKWKYSPRFRTKYHRGAASLFLRKYVTLRKGVATALVVVDSDTAARSWMPNTNTSIEEKQILYQEIPKYYFRETFLTRLNNIKLSVHKYNDSKAVLISRKMPKYNMQEVLRILYNNVSNNASKHYSKERGLFSYILPKSAVTEAFRTLRTNISFSSLKGSNKVILITSPGTEDGKSTVAANLGVVMAQAQSRVLIVDCDLRKPVMRDYFRLDKASGLTNLLVQDLQPEDVVSETEVERLYVISSGPIPPNPSELLGSAKMAEFLSRVAEQYDVVLLDTPPVIAVTDAVLLSPLADSVLLVLKAGETRIEMAKEARERLMNAGSKSIGVVLNGAKPRGRDYNNYYYYGSQDNT
jgi:capsular exopolysaccharide synthesis family protein